MPNKRPPSLLLMSESYGSRYSRMDRVKFFKGCLPQILVGPFLNTLTFTHMEIVKATLISY